MKTKVYFTFLGTTQHRDKDPNLLLGFHKLVAKYAKTKEGSDIAEYLFDGVGCVGTKENPTPGTYVLVGVGEKEKKIAADLVAQSEVSDAEEDEAFSSQEIKKQVVKFSNALTLRLTRYRITGEGVDSLMLEAILYLENLLKENNGVMPLEINLNGFSRGADTCVRLAHILQDFCPETKVNLFLVDPVPGPGRYDDKSSYVIPSNVENCQIIVMANEHIPVIKSQDMDSYVFANMATKVKYNILPGNHSSGILRKPGNQVGSDEAYKLVQDALLKDNIKRGLLPSSTCIYEEYGLVEKKCKIKDLSLKKDYIVYNAQNIKGDISYDKIIKRFKNKKKDVLFLKDGNLYYLDTVFKSITKINYADLSKNKKVIYDFYVNKIKNTPKGFYYNIRVNKDNIRRLVAPNRHIGLNKYQEFSTYCNALFDFNAKSERAKVALYYSRDAMVNRGKHIRCADLFLDEGHRSSFINLFPNLNAWFFKLDYSKNEQKLVIQELIKLKEINYLYAKEFAKHFKFDLDAAISSGQIEKLTTSPIYSEDVYGKEVGRDSLSYLRFSLQNVVNLCKHKILKTEYDRKMVLTIKAILDETFNLPEKMAVKTLQRLVNTINNSKETGVVCFEIRKIIYMPDVQYNNFIEFIRTAENLPGLEEGQKLILRDLFASTMNNKASYFSWEKYIALRDKAIQLQASLLGYSASHKLDDDAIQASTQLSQKLIDFYSVDYGIPTAIDSLVGKLRSYQRWSMFFAYFPKSLNFFDNAKYAKIDKLIDMLNEMPHAAKNDLFTLEKILNKNIEELFSMKSNGGLLQNQSSNFSLLNRYLFNALNKAIISIKNTVMTNQEARPTQTSLKL